MAPGDPPKTAAPEELVTQPCGPEDRAEQVELFNACFKKRVEVDNLKWRYDRCPHGRSTTVVTRPTGGRAVSGYACNPRRVLHRGDETTATIVGETGDVMTHPDWRGRGIFSALDAAAMRDTAERGWAGVFGLPNRKSAHIFCKIGWDQVGTIRPWSFVLRATKEAKAERFREGRLAAWTTGRAAKGCARALKSLQDAVGQSFTARPLQRFPDEVEALSRQVEADFDWMVRRDADYLNWRFIDTPTQAHRVQGIFDRQDRLAGYVVVQPPSEGSTVGHLVDVLAADPVARSLAVATGLVQLRERGASLAQSWAIDGSFWQEVLQTAGFLPPKPENHLIVIHYTQDPDHPVARAGADASRWYLTDGDRDDETVG